MFALTGFDFENGWWEEERWDFLKKNAVYKYKAEEKNEIDSRGVFTHKTKRFRAEVRRKNIFAGWKRGEAFDMEIQKHKKHEKMVKKIFMLIMGRMKK